jgi:hypothetical protein
VSAGGNDVRVGDIGLRIADPDTLLAQARSTAVKEATAEARQYAAATGQTLGQVLSLREVHASPVVPQALHFSRDALSQAKAALPIRAGKSRLAVTVRIEWSFG